MLEDVYAIKCETIYCSLVFNCFYLYLLLVREIIAPIGNLEKSKPPDGNRTDDPP